ncbi:MAG: hypothetical protein RL348_773 [Bacteroidota bacterium]|jgi:hypothetical protein
MESNDSRQRMSELVAPINRQIMMCDDRNDILMIASAMLVLAKDIFDNEIGIKGRKEMFKNFSE